MRQGIRIVLIVILILIFLFCLSGVFMAGSFSVPTPVKQKEYYIGLINTYIIGVTLSMVSIVYLSFFSKTSKGNINE